MNWKAVLRVISAVVVSTLATFQLYNMATAPSVELSADVRFGAVMQPNDDTDKFEEFRSLFAVDSLIANIDLNSVLPDSIGNDEIGKVEQRVFQKVHDYWTNRLLWRYRKPYSSLGGYWDLTVRNGESQQIASVEVILPGAVLVKTEREGEEASWQSVDEVLQIGRMRPGETVSLIAWTRRPPARGDADEIRITHEKGTGKTKVFRRAGPVGQFVDDNFGLLLFELFMFGLLAFSVIALIRILREGKGQQAETDSAPQLPPEL